MWEIEVRKDLVKPVSTNLNNTNTITLLSLDHIMDKLNKLKLEAINPSTSNSSNQNKNAFKKIFTPVRIAEWLFLGNHKDSESHETLKSNNIECILNATIECKNKFPKLYDYKKIPVCDTVKTNIKFYFDDAANYLENCRIKGKKVLVHCYMGRSRSTSCILAYFIKYKGYSYESAYLHVKSLKADIQPNEGFVRQLRQYEEEVKGEKKLKL